jgi:hypothetical protein
VLWDSQTGTRLESVTVAPLCSVCSDRYRKSEGHFYPLSIIENQYWMGRSLEVRSKSENLPVVGCTLVWEPVSPGTD